MRENAGERPTPVPRGGLALRRPLGAILRLCGGDPRTGGPSLPVEPGDGPACGQLAPGVVSGHPGGSPPTRDLDGGDGGPGGHEIAGHPDAGRVSGERAFEPGGPCHGGEAAGHGASGAEAEHAGVRIRVLGADLPDSSGGPLPEVLDGSFAFLVGLRAADREPSRSIRPELDIGPFERGRFGAPEHGVPHDGGEGDVHGSPDPGRFWGFRPSGGTRAGSGGRGADRGQRFGGERGRLTPPLPRPLTREAPEDAPDAFGGGRVRLPRLDVGGSDRLPGQMERREGARPASDRAAR